MPQIDHVARLARLALKMREAAVSPNLTAAEISTFGSMIEIVESAARYIRQIEDKRPPVDFRRGAKA